MTLFVGDQQTLARDAHFEGRGLFGGREVVVDCRPAPAGTGIVFRRADLPGRPEVAARVADVVGDDRMVVLRRGRAEVRLVEHLLAAAAGVGITNMVVEISAAEAPALDGSAAPYGRAFIEAGLVAQGVPQECFAPSEEIAVEEKDAWLRLAPAGNEEPRAAVPQALWNRCAARRVAQAPPPVDELTVSFTLDYGECYIGRQSKTIVLTPETFLEEIAPARTYALREEVQAFLECGLGGGATEENVVIVERDGSTAQELRFADECVRHKILDLVGDLSLAGVALQGEINGFRSGHGLNTRLARAVGALHP
ncbi:MAG: UDP-3-O-acyl-N-acetylglucosamine deacetylase [Bradyrhizobium sp.]|nr:UDP-3-O-acyl-N-acetylglucosamine deacetylase [Bradyrhizobium sp.]